MLNVNRDKYLTINELLYFLFMSDRLAFIHVQRRWEMGAIWSGAGSGVGRVVPWVRLARWTWSTSQELSARRITRTAHLQGIVHACGA
jgi:hypothetical protein